MAEALDTEMVAWPPGTKHYQVEPGEYVAVDVDPGEIPEGAANIIEGLLVSLGSSLSETKIVLRDTVIIPCNEEGIASSMDPIHRFPPGTSHEDALTQAGLA